MLIFLFVVKFDPPTGLLLVPYFKAGKEMRERLNPTATGDGLT